MAESKMKNYKKLDSGICHWCDWAYKCHGKSNKCAKRLKKRQKHKRYDFRFEKIAEQ